MTVYLLHFDEPVGEPQTTEARLANGLPPREGAYQPHAQHYMGYTKELRARLNAHRFGKAARLTQVACERGIHFQLARTWLGGNRQLEKKLKARKNHRKLCPICRRLTQ